MLCVSTGTEKWAPALVGLTFWCECSVAQSYLTLHSPIKCSLPGLSVHGILQARILEWVVMPSFRGSSRPRDRTHIPYVSCTAGRFSTTSTTSFPQLPNCREVCGGREHEQEVIQVVGAPCSRGGAGLILSSNTRVSKASGCPPPPRTRHQ